MPARLRIMKLNHSAQIRLDTVSENCIFYISTTYEFSHSLGPRAEILELSIFGPLTGWILPRARKALEFSHGLGPQRSQAITQPVRPRIKSRCIAASRPVLRNLGAPEPISAIRCSVSIFTAAWGDN